MKSVAQILASKPDPAVYTMEPSASAHEATPVMYVHLHQKSDECMALMTQNRIHVPVMDDGQLVGLMSIGDLVKATISEQQFIIEQLEHYITGQRS